MKKRYLAVMAATMTTMAVTACSGNQTTTETTAVETTTAAASAVTTATETSAAETTAAAAEKPIQEKPLVVYLNDFDGVIGDLFKEATGYDVEVVVGNGAETMSRIAAEKGNPQWDVVWIDSMYDVYNLSQDEELLTGWEPENAAKTRAPLYGLLSPTVIPVQRSYTSQI